MLTTWLRDTLDRVMVGFAGEGRSVRLWVAGGVFVALACITIGLVSPTQAANPPKTQPPARTSTMTDDFKGKTEQYWKEHLTPEQFEVLRHKGTERAGTGEYAHTKTPGIYRCAGCGQELFS